MSLLYQLLLLSLVELIIETICWGTGGYLLIQLFLKNRFKWYFEFLIILIPFLLYEYWSSQVLLQIDMIIMNIELIEFFGEDLKSIFETDFISILLSTSQICVGFLIGKYVYSKLIVMSSRSRDF